MDWPISMLFGSEFCELLGRFGRCNKNYRFINYTLRVNISSVLARDEPFACLKLGFAVNVPEVSYLRSITLITFLCLWLFACGTDTSSGEQVSAGSASGSSSPGTSASDVTVTTSSGGPSPTQSQTKFSLRITDAPVDNVTKVVLTFTAVELLADNGSDSIKFSYKNPQVIDLLQLQGTTTANLLSSVPVSSGSYQELRLFVDDASMASFVELTGGGVESLKVPSGSSSGLKIKGDVNIITGEDTSYTLDFDLRQSVTKAGNSGKYILKPVIRLIEDAKVGHIRGLVDSPLLLAASCSDANVDTFNSLYVFEGHNIVPTDINQSSTKLNQPIATSVISYDADSGGYLFEAAFLPEGDYTIALTCNSDADDLEADDDLKFFNIKNVVVLINNTTFL